VVDGEIFPDGRAGVDVDARLGVLLLKDLTANYNGDPAASSRQEIILSYPGMFAIFIYRIAHELYLEKVPMIPRP